VLAKEYTRFLMETYNRGTGLTVDRMALARDRLPGSLALPGRTETLG
jgi:hypothetical protein